MHLHVPRPSQGGAPSATPATRPRATLVAVHAHPDDECLPTGGILARYAAEGVRTVLVTCTGGEVGEIADPALATPENLGEVRARELAESVRILGIDRAVQLGYRDSGMAGTADNDHPASFLHADLDRAIGRVVAILREERADVVVTYDENGGYGHPDHIRAHQVAVAAFRAAGDPTRYPEAGPPWAPRKLYYAILTRSALRRFGEALRAAGVEVPFRAGREPGHGRRRRPPDHRRRRRRLRRDQAPGAARPPHPARLDGLLRQSPVRAVRPAGRPAKPSSASSRRLTADRGWRVTS